MGFRTEHFHVWEKETTVEIASKSELAQRVSIPVSEWEEIVAWYTGNRVQTPDDTTEWTPDTALDEAEKKP